MFEELRDGTQGDQATAKSSIRADSKNIEQKLAPEQAKLSLITTTTPVEQAQEAIIAYFIPYLNHSLPMGRKIPETDPKASREAFIQTLREDRIPTEEENKFLLTFPSKVDEAAQVFDQVSSDLHE